jgi:hypothetical protein
MMTHIIMIVVRCAGDVEVIPIVIWRMTQSDASAYRVPGGDWGPARHHDGRDIYFERVVNPGNPPFHLGFGDTRRDP